MLNWFFDRIFGWLIEWSSLGGLAIISFVLTLIITLAYKLLTDQEVMKSLRKEMKELQEQIKQFKSNPSKMMEVQKVMMEKNMRYMVQGFKPMLITLLPIILVFGWLKGVYNGYKLPFFSWIWWYIIFSIIFSTILRKILKVH